MHRLNVAHVADAYLLGTLLVQTGYIYRVKYFCV